MSTYLAFVATATGAVLMPGPDMLVVLRTALTAGARAGAWAAAGSAAGNLLWGAATVLGATALLTMSGAAFSALKLAGAAYLGWLGLQALRAARRGELLAEDGEAGKPPSAAKAFRRGLASDLANVKVGLFWTALVPQFMTSAGSVLLGAMVVTMAGLAFVALAGFALAAGRLRVALARPHVSRAVNGTVGVLLVGLAAKLATG
jgi:threonine/homoserine/homoserine lactone efflux protein